MFFGETLDAHSYVLEGYGCVHLPAIQQEKGRPVRGLLMAIKHGIPFEVLSYAGRHIHVKLTHQDLSVAGFYFEPETDVDDIVSEIMSTCLVPGAGKNMIVCGDFNCRMDSGLRGEQLRNMLATSGLLLTTETQSPTYECSAGRSVIDLTFTNCTHKLIGSRQRTVITSTSLIPKKHKQQISVWNFKPAKEAQHRERIVRKIDPDALPANLLNDVHRLLSNSKTADNNGLEKAVEAMTSALKDAICTEMPAKNRQKPWFGRDCYEMLLRVKRSQGREREVAHKQFCRHVNERKREWYDQKLTKRVLSSVAKPWIMFAGRERNALPWQMTSQIITDHLSNLYCRHEEDPVCRHVNEGNKELDKPFSVEEVIDAILHTADKKAAGIDGICNEHLKGSLPATKEAWTAIFNHCLETGSLPSTWQQCESFLLFKGKGLPADANNYRLICLLDHILKVLTKLIKCRLQNAFDCVLDDDQLGFRKDRSTTDAIRRFAGSVAAVFAKGSKGVFRYCLFVDFCKAFDSVCRQLLIDKLTSRFGLGGTSRDDEAHHIIFAEQHHQTCKPPCRCHAGNHSRHRSTAGRQLEPIPVYHVHG